MTRATRIDSRRGFTLIEALVSIGVIGILTALLLPAVQGAREASRRAACANNLRQIGLAVHGYTDAHHAYPPNWLRDEERNPSRYVSMVSVQARILPYLEQTALYDSINFQCSLVSEPLIEPNHEQILYEMPRTVFTTRISTFLCPSDHSPLRHGPASSYRASTGEGPHLRLTEEYPDSGNGLFPERGNVSPSDVADGLSHTAAFSERNLGSGRLDSPSPDRDCTNAAILWWRTADDILKVSRIAARRGNFCFANAGEHWFWGWRASTLYTHTQEPNGRVPDGIVQPDKPIVGMVTARSQHPGGVNLLMGDGSTRFVTESISRAVWRGLGTRSGGELVE